MIYKSLICDVDGTLIPKVPHSTLSQKAKQALSEASNYLSVSVATARPFTPTKNLFTSLSFLSPSIFSNGAQIVDVQKKTVLFDYPMDFGVVRNVCTVLEKFPVTFWIQDNGYDRKWKGYKPQKPYVIVVSHLQPHFADSLQHQLSKIQGIAISKSMPELNNTADLLITQPLGTKQHAVLELCKVLGVSRSEVIGIGDDYNDISFLMACGLKVAMGNAIPEVKDIADYIVPPVGHDGIVDVIHKFIL